MSEPRLSGRLLLVANLVAANAAAAGCVLGFARPSFVGIDSRALLPVLGDSRVAVLPLDTGIAWLVFLLALLLLLANFAWLVRQTPTPAPRHYVTSETPTGPVRIAREALEGGLRAAGEALPEITRLRIQVDPGQQKRVLVAGQFQCPEGVNNLTASQRLRQALRDRFSDMVRLGEGTRVEFELEFQGFAGRLPRKAGELPPPEVDAPFTGPKYPIDDDEGDRP